MGATLSNLPELPDNFEHFAITFRLPDTVKILHADEKTQTRISTTISDNYAPGIHAEKASKKEESLSITLLGSPFNDEKYGHMSPNADRQMVEVFSSRLCCELLKDLHKIGWSLVLSSDVSRATDLATWFFRKTPRTSPLIEEPLSIQFTRIICISLISHDSIRFVNAPRDMFPIFRQILQSGYGYGLHGSKGGGDKILGGGLAYEIILGGWPWRTTNLEESLFARRAILEIFRQLRNKGYRYCGTTTGDCMFFEQAPELPPPMQDYLLLSLVAPDILRLIDAPKDVISTVRDSIFESLGSKKLQKEADYISRYNCFEFLLYGSPWTSSGPESIYVRQLVSMIFRKLRHLGWKILASLDLSRRHNDKASFVFKSCQPKEDVPHICLSPADSDKLRLINPCRGATQLIRNVIKMHWPYGVYKESITTLQKTRFVEWKLNGDPWEYKSGFDYTLTRHLTICLIDEFTKAGWEILCSADVSSKYIHQARDPDYPVDVHSWYLAYLGGPRDQEAEEESYASYASTHADSEATDSQVDQIHEA